MSTQRGNPSRKRPQKYQNSTVFKNNLHDTSQKTKQINSLELYGLCARCKDTIEWKIKYKKYKPLSQPKKCIKCEQKAVKRAYCVVCLPCSQGNQICGKCAQKSADIHWHGKPSPQEEAKKQAAFNEELKTLTERQRRTFMRYYGNDKPLPDDLKSALEQCRAEAGNSDSDDEDDEGDKDNGDDFDTDNEETEESENALS